MQKTPETRELSADDVAFVEAWALEHQGTLPSQVVRALALVTTLYHDLTHAKKKAADLVRQLRMAMGFEPKSEKGRADKRANALTTLSDAAIGDEAKIESLKEQRREITRQLRRYHSRRSLATRPPKKLRKAGTAEFARTSEAVFVGPLADKAQRHERRMDVSRDKEFLTPRGLHAARDKRKRYQFQVTTAEITLSVETVTDPRTGKSVTASTDEVGPPGFQVTWVAIANALVAIIGHAIPINRLSTMLKASLPYFTAARICKMLDYAADLFAPIYEHLGGAIADCDVLNGDDTKARVLEVKRQLEAGKALAEPKGLVRRMAEMFGRVSRLKTDERDQKELNVSVLIGKTDVMDPRSYVFFFRTHIGRLGNLLTEVLKQRNPKKKALTLQTDLSSSNRPDPELYRRFDITHAGCGPHARRPFWRYRGDDETLCYWMLSAFLILERIEDKIDDVGRSRATVMHYRQKYAKKIWAAILRRCESVARGERTYADGYWPKTSKLSKACRYIVKNYPELSKYLDDPRLTSSNNVSERALRWEKAMEDSSGFRQTERGRLNVDILRTIVHTCAAAEVDLKDYLLFVFMNRSRLEEQPHHYTPFAFAKLGPPASPVH